MTDKPQPDRMTVGHLRLVNGPRDGETIDLPANRLEDWPVLIFWGNGDDRDATYAYAYRVGSVTTTAVYRWVEPT